MIKSILTAAVLVLALNGAISICKTFATTKGTVFKIVSAQAAMTPSEALDKSLRSPQSVPNDVDFSAEDLKDDEFCFAVFENIEDDAEQLSSAEKACFNAGYTRSVDEILADGQIVYAFHSPYDGAK